ncbi:DUF1877 family protein [Streptomyces sp. NPDC096105]|uniref:DUF1877 family protein n=1 Tax=Streptomyces sp. NPDC096105 TaxID=3366074 RepID=UPI0037FD5216
MTRPRPPAPPHRLPRGRRPRRGGEDRSYGPPRCLTPEQVRTAAEALAATPPARLTEGVTPSGLAAAGVTPHDRPGARGAAGRGDRPLRRPGDVPARGGPRRGRRPRPDRLSARTPPPLPGEPDRGGRGGDRVGHGRAWTCGPTALDQALPAVASQLVDQVIAPRRSG